MTEPTDILSGVMAFHGHLCPGLLIGYRAALIGLRELAVRRARDEELVAICETDACGVDAVQYLTGCTAGKGNLMLRDWGKQVYTFGRRSDGRLVRVALRYGSTREPAAAGREEKWQAAIERMRDGPEVELFAVRWVERPLPAEAQIYRTVQCSQCGEGVMEARARLREGEIVCPECYGETCR